MNILDILALRNLIDFQCWYDITFGYCMRARYQGRDIAWINGGTPEQLTNRYNSLEFMSYVNKARNINDGPVP